jgi:hypothetical protein
MRGVLILIQSRSCGPIHILLGRVLILILYPGCYPYLEIHHLRLLPSPTPSILILFFSDQYPVPIKIFTTLLPGSPGSYMRSGLLGTTNVTSAAVCCARLRPYFVLGTHNPRADPLVGPLWVTLIHSTRSQNRPGRASN